MKKKTLSLLLALTLLLGLLPAASLAEESAAPAAEPEIVLEEELSASFDGSGTQEDPYRLTSTEDLAALSASVQNGESYEGKYFQIVNDLTLPEDWIPLGIKGAPFSGIIDGGDEADNKTVTVPEGGLPLIGYPKEAVVRNLNIYGTKIESSGLVAYYTTANSNCTAITIENVTLKEGTQTLQSGFVSGYASGTFPVVIRDCTVEQGVVIGYDGTQSNVGSFGGDFNGTIENCVSYATVKGVDFVGGIVGSKGQSMGDYIVRNCAFFGSVEASGQYVGGIAGHGYGGTMWGMASSPNAGCATVENCLSAGSVTGATNVGGILGAEAGVVQCWNNGIGYLRSNLFVGTLSATNPDGVSGGIVGYMKSLNRYNVIGNNFYLGTAASQGIGQVDYVDTSFASPTAVEGVTYVNSANGSTGISGMSKTDHNRTDDPLGADLEALFCAADTDALENGDVLALLNSGEGSLGNWTQGDRWPVNREVTYTRTLEGLSVSGDYKTSYNVGEDLDLSGIVLTARWSDDTETTLSLDDVTVTGYNKSMAAVQTVTILYDTATAEITVTVLQASAPSESDTIRVSFTLLGDSIHGEESVHTMIDGTLTSWIGTTSVTVPKNATVMDVVEKILTQKGYTWQNDDVKNGTGNYMQSITTPDGVTLGEFTNGSRSGWMYTLNGKYPELGISEQVATTGDRIVLHYTDDYSKERASESLSSGGSSGSSTAELPPEGAVTITENPDGSVTVQLSEQAQKDAAANGKGGIPVTLPADAAEAGSVLVRVASDGTETVVKKSVLEGNSVTGLVDGSCTVKVVNNTKSFADTENHWAKDAIAFASSHELFGGVGGGQFAPDAPMSRAMLATVLYRLEDASASGGSVFSDVPNGVWYTDAVAWASESGIVKGTGHGFDPDGGVTREQLVVMLFRYAQLLGLDTTAAGDLDRFADGEEASDWARDAMAWAIGNGLITGKGGGIVDPAGGATRAEVAAILQRMVALLVT